MDWQPIDENAKSGELFIIARYDGRVRCGKFHKKFNVWKEVGGNIWGTNAATHYIPLPPPPKDTP